MPEGFVPVPEKARLPGFPYGFACNRDQPERTILIYLRGAGAKVAGNEITPEDMAKVRSKYPDADRFPARWKSTPVEGFRFTLTEDGVRTVNFSLTLATQPEAIHIAVIGPASEAAEARKYLDIVLQTLEAAPSSPSAPNELVIRVWHLVVIALVVLAVVYWGRRSRKGGTAPPASQGSVRDEQRGNAPPGG
jgi:hypothetical protein